MVTITPARWPCLQTEGLQVFNTTADQRFLLGEDIFMSTHFPIQMRRYRNSQPLSIINEVGLLDELVHEEGVAPGNRVFFLYGAAGAGKSELLRWLQTSISHRSPNRAKHMIRINRNELNVLSIVEKFRFLLSNTYFSATTHQRWEEAHRKPRTIAKLILLSALEKTFESDDFINMLFYRLLDWIQPRVERALLIEKVGEDYNIPIELLSREDLVELQAQSIFTLELDYEQFRFFLSKAFQDLLLEGSSLHETLRQISDQLFPSKIRPILLVDDLVQSLSIFSTDLLDYCITLDEGNWDVVIGLTPNALTDNIRGKQLLDRITYLDTFDDRVNKLFLSDVRGDDSYFLNAENCSAFLGPYLEVFRSYSGNNCNGCPFLKTCVRVFGQEGDIPLAPFNSILLRRIYNNLPDGKGKARQFLRVIREILYIATTTRQMENSLAGQVILDIAVESPNNYLSTLVEYYFPTVIKLERRKVEKDFLSAFNFDICPVEVDLYPLRREVKIDRNEIPQTAWLENTSSLAVKNWLDGKPVNRQSLQLLRRGTARWLRDVFSIGSFHLHTKPRPHRILRWNGIYLDVRPPILLEGVDDDTGIYLSPQIGFLAFHLSEYALVNGSQRTFLAGLIASDLHTPEIIHNTYLFQTKLEETLTTQLDRTPAQFSAELIALFWMLGDASHMEPIPLFRKLPVISPIYPIAQASIKILEYSRLLFEDFYMLREQLYDYASFHRYLARRSLDELSFSFLSLNPSQISPEFGIGDLSLKEYISKVQQRIMVWQNPLLSSDLNFVHTKIVKSFAEYGKVGLPFDSVPIDIWSMIKTNDPEVYQRLRIYLDSDSSPGSH